MKKFIKEIISLTIFLLFLFLVSIGGALLIKYNLVEIVLFLLIVWIILLYVWKGASEEKYKQLLHFAHKFYREEKKMKADEGDYEDYNLSDFEAEFEDWLTEKNYAKYDKIQK